MKSCSFYVERPTTADLKIVDVNANNVGEYGLCGFRKAAKSEGYERNRNWLRKRFAEGMKVKVLHSEKEGTVGFIEYVPGEFAWRPIEAQGYMVIHCMMVYVKEYQGKGYGSLLLRECLKDAKNTNMNGVAAVTSKGPWMAGNELFLKNGFECVDQTPPSFELLVKQLKSAPSPRFRGDWEKKLGEYGSGLTVIRSEQCPLVIKWVDEIVETAEREYGITPRVVEIRNAQEAQNAPTPFGVFGIIHDGKLIAEHPISNKRFMNIMNKILK